MHPSISLKSRPQISWLSISGYRWLALGSLLAAAGFKVFLLFSGKIPFNSDEAVVALMARHFLQGARPIFFYGQAYMGSLDAILVAAGFSIFGEQVWVIRLVQSLLYMGTLGTTLWLGKEAFGSYRTGAVAISLLAVPAVNVTLYTTASLGGYGEALLIGNLILLAALRIGKSGRAGFRPASLWLWLASGFLSGLGLWAFGLTLVYSLPAAAFLTWNAFTQVRRGQAKGKIILLPAFLYLAGGMLGAAPWLGYAWQHGFGELLGELRGGAIASVEQIPWAARAGQHVVNLLLLGVTALLGLRPPWEARWLALPLSPLALAFWVAVIIRLPGSLKNDQHHRPQKILLLGVVTAVVLAFILTPFGADPSGRYFITISIILALFAGEMILQIVQSHGRWAWSMLVIVVLFQLWGTVQCLQRFPPGLTTQFNSVTVVDHRYDAALIDFLRQRGETRGYTNYWVTYPLAFLSQEDLIFTPRLPYHLDFRYTARDDRYAPYDQAVESASRIAYITTNHPPLDQYLRGKFQEQGVRWQEAEIGDYHVFYALSRLIRPQEIGLGETTP